MNKLVIGTMSSKRKKTASERLAELQDELRRRRMDGESQLELQDLTDDIEQARVETELERAHFEEHLNE